MSKRERIKAALRLVSPLHIYRCAKAWNAPLKVDLSSDTIAHPRVGAALVTLLELFEATSEAKNFLTMKVEYLGLYQVTISKVGIDPWHAAGVYGTALKEAGIKPPSIEGRASLLDKVKARYILNGDPLPDWLKEDVCES